MSNKSEAAWHPNSGPATNHADLIAEARALRTDSPRGDLISVARQLTDALVVLSNSIPHDVDCEAVHFAGSVAPPWTPCGCDERRVATAQRERDEARAERDALAAQLAEVDAAVGDPEHPRFSQPHVRARMHAIVEAATANEDERDRILALHDAEVKAQALDEAATAGLTRNDHEGYAIGVCDCGNLDEKVARGLLRDRAAAIRAEAE